MSRYQHTKGQIKDNAIEALLLGRGLNKGIDYDRESGKFEFSGKEEDEWGTWSRMFL